MAVPARFMTQQFDRARRTLVVGLGETGLSVVRYLSRQGASVAIVDSRENPPGLARLQADLPENVALFLGGFHQEAFERAEQIVISPGVPADTPEIVAARVRDVPVIGDVELFAQAVQAPVIAVTGSNGKSTVVTLLSAMARRAGRDVRTGGNIGTPALDLIEANEPDLYVLELSSFQLETLASLQPQAAVVLNISADHLDRYRDLQAYARAKQAIYKQAGMQVVNRDDPVAAALVDTTRPHTGFTRQVPHDNDYGLREYAGEVWLARGIDRIMPLAGVCMAGDHNILNALAALALGEAAGLSLDAMIEILGEFQGLPHRMQFLVEQEGVRWFNDSKGTNVGATVAAIEGVQGKLVLIAGGDGKGADFSLLAEPMQRKGRAAVLIGKDAALLDTALQQAVPVRHAADMQQAVRLAAGLAQAGDSVLMSPACASTDMFQGFADRGEAFMRAVRECLQ